jgi:hypothetical protein
MLLHNRVAGSACKQLRINEHSVKFTVVPVHAAMPSMYRSHTASPVLHKSHTHAALRPSTISRRTSVQTRAFFDKLFKQDPAEKTRKQYQDRVDAINALEPQMQSLSDEQLRAKTFDFKQRVQGGESLESVLPEAFAVSCSCPHFPSPRSNVFAWMNIPLIMHFQAVLPCF